MRRAALRSLLAVVPLLAAATFAAPPATGPSVRGAVVDDAAQPLAGARVELVPVATSYANARARLAGVADAPPVAVATSGGDGRFHLSPPQPGVYAVRVSAPSRLRLQHIPCVLGRAVELPPVLLPASRQLAVRVVADDGRPVTGAEVLAVRAGTAGDDLPVWLPTLRRATTGGDGRAKLPRAVGEHLDVTVVAPGSGSLTVAGVDADTEIRLPASPRLVRLTVVDDAGSPVAGAVARIGQAAWPLAVSDDAGHLDVPVPPGHDLDLLLVAGPRRATHHHLAAPPAAAVPQTLVLPAVAELHGRIVDAAGSPLAGVVVWPGDDPGAFVVTDGAGRWTAPVPAAGTQWLQAEAAGRVPTRIVPTALQVARGRAPTVVLARASAVRGMVVDDLGAPLPGVHLAAVITADRGFTAADPADGRATSDDAGRFLLASLRPGGSYDLVATARGRATSRLPFVAPAAGGAAPDLRLTLLPRRAAFGRVVDTAERPVAGARITVLPHGPEGVTVAAPASSPPGAAGADEAGTEAGATGVATSGLALSGDDGRFRLAALPSTEIDAAVSAEGYSRLVVRRITVPPDEPKPVATAVPRPALHAASSAGPGRGAEATPGGTADAGPAGPPPVDLGTFVLAVGGSVHGTVTDRTGTPVAAAAIHVLPETFGARLFRNPAFPHLLDRRRPDATSRSDGTFAVDDLPRDEHPTVVVRAVGHLAALVHGVVVGGDPLSVVLAPAATLVGRVLDDAGAPLPGAAVRLHWRDHLPGAPEGHLPGGGQAAAVTDEEGRFELGEIRPGPVEIAASAARFIDSESRRVVAQIGEPLQLTFQLQRGATLHGVVLTEDGDPVADAHVVVSGAGAGTDAEGAYAIDGVRPGEHVRGRAIHPGHGRVTRDLEVLPGDNQVDWTLPAGAAVSGVVVTAADGEPVPGAQVELAGPEGIPVFDAVSDGAGAFRFPALPEGRYVLAAAAPGLARAEATEPVTVTAEPVTDLRLALAPAARVEGDLIGLTFAEVARVAVTASRSGEVRAATVDHRGRYVVDDLGYGVWTVEAKLDRDRRQAAARAELGPDRLRAELDLEFGDGATLSGEVLLDGQPLAGAAINLQGETVAVRRHLVTDHLGAFTTADLPVGAYRMSVRHPRHMAVYNDRIDVDGDRRVVVELELSSLRGHVADGADGAPLEDALIALQRAGRGEGLILATSDAEGDFSVPELAAGAYALRVTRTGYAPALSQLEVAPGGEAVVDVDLEPSAGLRLSLHLADGQSRPGPSPWCAPRPPVRPCWPNNYRSEPTAPSTSPGSHPGDGSCSSGLPAAP